MDERPSAAELSAYESAVRAQVAHDVEEELSARRVVAAVTVVGHHPETVIRLVLRPAEGPGVDTWDVRLWDDDGRAAYLTEPFSGPGDARPLDAQPDAKDHAFDIHMGFLDTWERPDFWPR